MSFGQLSNWLEQSTIPQLTVSLPKRSNSDFDNQSKTKIDFQLKYLHFSLASAKRQCIK
jgi:hypothetical protein